MDPVESAVRMIGTLVLGLSILHDNLVGFDLFPWRVSLANYGMGVFVLGLGFVTARVFFADQREFAAVERELETARFPVPARRRRTLAGPRRRPGRSRTRVRGQRRPCRSSPGRPARERGRSRRGCR